MSNTSCFFKYLVRSRFRYRRNKSQCHVHISRLQQNTRQQNVTFHTTRLTLKEGLELEFHFLNSESRISFVSFIGMNVIDLEIGSRISFLKCDSLKVVWKVINICKLNWKRVEFKMTVVLSINADELSSENEGILILLLYHNRIVAISSSDNDFLLNFVIYDTDIASQYFIRIHKSVFWG